MRCTASIRWMPLIESSEVLLAKGGGETEERVYRFTKGDSRSVPAIRSDRTAGKVCCPALRRADLPVPPFPDGKVYRGERAQRGRFREFYQADIDVIGDGKLDIINEAEVPSIIYKTFTSLGLQRLRFASTTARCLTASSLSSV